MALIVDKLALLKKLAGIKYEKPEDRAQDRLEQLSLSGALLTLAKIDHEKEYTLCRSVAEHLLGSLPETDEAELDDA